MGILKIRLKNLSGLVVYALVDMMLRFVLFGTSACAGESVCVLDTFVTLTAIIFVELILIPSFNNLDSIRKEL